MNFKFPLKILGSFARKKRLKSRGLFEPRILYLRRVPQAPFFTQQKADPQGKIFGGALFLGYLFLSTQKEVALGVLGDGTVP
jgi:hypothetical protein